MPGRHPPIPAAPAASIIAGHRTAIACQCLLVAAVLVLFGRLATYEFTIWDDQGTIHANPRLNPPTWESVKFYWTHADQGLYVPVTWTVWIVLATVGRVSQPDAVDSTLNPWLYHGVNVLLHAAASVLVFRLLRRLVGEAHDPRSSWACLAGALLFAVHPLQVETVAWVSGTKDLLCWTLGLGALLLYLRAAQADRESLATVAEATTPVADDSRASTGPPSARVSPAWRQLARPALVASVVLLALACLSKPTAMVLVAAAGVIDLLLVRRPLRRVAVALAPWLAVAVACAAEARVAQDVTYIVVSPLWARPFVAGDALAFYLGKLVWPASLAIDYGRRPAALLAMPTWWLHWLVPAAVGIAVVLFGRRWRMPSLPAGALLFVIGCAPVLGLVSFQMQQYSTVADHYLYFSLFGVALVVTDAVDRALRKGGRAPAVAGAVAGVVIAALAARAWAQVTVWHDSEALFTNTLRVTPGSAATLNNLGVVYLNRRDPSRGLEFFERSRRADPDYTLALLNMGMANLQLGQRDAATAAFDDLERATERVPNVNDVIRASILIGIAERYWLVGDHDTALRYVDRAIERATVKTGLQRYRERIVREKDAMPTTRPAGSSTTPRPA